MNDNQKGKKQMSRGKRNKGKSWSKEDKKMRKGKRKSKKQKK